jgi:sulfotransferase family protein
MQFHPRTVKLLTSWQKDSNMGTLIRIGYVLNYVFSRDIAGRTVSKFPDDSFLIAYPGAGGQWLRRLVGNLLQPGAAVTGANIQQRVPDLYHGSRRSFMQMTRPRVIFSHECYDADCHGRVVYLVRDPRDVAVSMYEERRAGLAKPDSLALQQFVATEFMRTDQYQGGWAEDFSGIIQQNESFSYLSRLKEEFLGTPASWAENVMSWLGARGEDPEVLLTIRYEDLFSHPEDVLQKVSAFLQIPASAEQIRTAIKVSREAVNSEWPQRPGKWQTDLPQEAVREIEMAWGEVMLLFSYSPVTLGAHSGTQNLVENNSTARL